MKAPVARLQVLAAALLFATGGTVIKASTLDAWQIASFRSGMAAIVLLALVPGWRRFAKPETLLVGLAYASTLILYVNANRLTTAANAIFLQSTAPLYLLLLSPRLLGEKPTRNDIACTGVLAVGMALFFLGDEPAQRTAPDPQVGNWVAAASGATWALTLVGLRWLAIRDRDREAAGRAVVAGNVLAFLICLPFALPVARVSGGDALVVGYLGAFQIGLAYVWLTRGVRSLSALEVSLLILLEPVANAFLTWVVHGERPAPWSLAGCGVILIATCARAFAGRRLR